MTDRAGLRDCDSASRRPLADPAARSREIEQGGIGRLIEGQAAIRAELSAIRRAVETLAAGAAAGRQGDGPRDADDRAVVVALAGAIERAATAVEAGDRLAAVRFTASAVRRHARHDGSLRAALVAADAISARSIGRLLARVEGHAIDGLAVTRCGGRGGTADWRLVSSVSSVSAEGGV